MNDETNKFIEAIKLILPYYEVGEFKEFIDVEKAPEAGGNIVLIFETSKGKYVLKEYTRNKDKLHRIEWLSQLLKINPNVKCPLVLTRKFKGSIQIGERFFSLERFVQGDTYFENYSDERLISCAKQLAELHKYLPQELEKDEHREENLSLTIVSRLFFPFKGEKSYFNQINDSSEKNESDLMLLREIFPFLKKQYDLMIRDIKKVKKSNRSKNLSLMHGDFQPFNIIFDGAEVAGLIDYESMYLGYANYEFIRGASLFSQINSEFSLDRFKLFVDSYKCVFGELDILEIEVMTYLRHSLLKVITFLLIRYCRDKANGIENVERAEVLNRYFLKLKNLIDNENLIINIFNEE